MRKRSDAKQRREEPAREWEVAVPSDAVNEQIVIASALVDDETRASLLKRIPPDAFSAETHRAIWSSLGEMHRRKLTYDPAVLCRLGGDAIDPRFLEQLSAARPEVPVNLDFHVATLEWDRQRAQATRGPISALLEAVQNPRETPERVRALARQVGQAFEGGTGRGRFLHDPKELVREQMAKIRARTEGQAIYPFGIEGLDFFEDGEPRLALGASPGACTVITASSGGGKTVMTANIALGLGRQKRRVLWGSWEVSGGMNLEVLAVISLGWIRKGIIRGKGPSGDWLTPEENVVLEDRMHAISKVITFMANPFRRFTGERLSNERNLDIIQAHIEDSGAEVFIADLWARCLVHDNPSEELQALYRQQAMLEEMQVHGILLHQQLTKGDHVRADRKPSREGLKGSSGYLEVCDTLIAPHLPHLWKNVPDDTMEAFILKQRHGGKWPLGIEFGWDGDRGRIFGGRSIPYDNPGDTDEFETGAKYPRPKGRRR